jgi:hypothetical protein
VYYYLYLLTHRHAKIFIIFCSVFWGWDGAIVITRPTILVSHKKKCKNGKSNVYIAFEKMLIALLRSGIFYEI